MSDPDSTQRPLNTLKLSLTSAQTQEQVPVKASGKQLRGSTYQHKFLVCILAAEVHTITTRLAVYYTVEAQIPTSLPRNYSVTWTLSESDFWVTIYSLDSIPFEG